MSISRVEVLRRAGSTRDKGCVYRLGRGGFDPLLPVPWGTRKECDCTGWLAWCLGVSRKTAHPWYQRFNGGWFESSAIYRDAVSPYGFATQIDASDLLPGDALVFPDRNGRQGHVRLVCSRVIHGWVNIGECASGPYRKTGDAVNFERVSTATLYVPVRFAWVGVDREQWGAT